MKGTFEELIASEKPVLIDFSAEWCGPCKQLAPILQQLANDMGDELRIIKIDIDQNPKLSQKYRVQSVPTLMVFKNSELKWRQTGALPLHQLKSKMKEFV